MRHHLISFKCQIWISLDFASEDLFREKSEIQHLKLGCMDFDGGVHPRRLLSKGFPTSSIPRASSFPSYRSLRLPLEGICLTFNMVKMFVLYTIPCRKEP
jgi:hypothetical protein